MRGGLHIGQGVHQLLGGSDDSRVEATYERDGCVHLVEQTFVDVAARAEVVKRPPSPVRKRRRSVRACSSPLVELEACDRPDFTDRLQGRRQGRGGRVKPIVDTRALQAALA